MKCEVCDTELADEYNDVGEGVLLESGGHCPNGCYFYQYAYGNSEEMIDGVTWTWSYTETSDESKARDEERKRVIAEARMKRMDTIECLWNAFNDAPDELFRLGIIADACDDIGDDDAANCLRWAWREGKKPRHWRGTNWDWSRYSNEYTNKIPQDWSLIAEDEDSGHPDTAIYINGSPTRSEAYQWLIRIWKHNGGIKEAVTA